ncbi:MAG: hypothetical protein AAB241_07370 [Pseudomonadota bacterium]
MNADTALTDNQYKINAGDVILKPYSSDQVEATLCKVALLEHRTERNAS